MTTPNEFLQFANEMGVGRIKSGSSSLSSPLMLDNNTYTTMGLSVLNNLCHLIEQIHELKSENNRLRAHLELVDHVKQYQQHFLLKDNQDNRKEKNELNISSTFIHDEEKSDTQSPTNSLKYKSHLLRRERKGIHLINNNQEDYSFVSQMDHDQSESVNHHSGTASPASNRNNWSKVRHALKFTLRRKQGVHSNPPSTNIERPIPTISISLESDDDHLQENKLTSKKKKIITPSPTTTSNTTTDNRQLIIGHDIDQDDELMHFINAYQRRRLYVNETSNASNYEHRDASASNALCNYLSVDDEVLLAPKQSKISRYRRKIRSKFDNVKRQFSDQNTSSSSMRPFNHSYGTTLDDIGSEFNRALLTAQIAPALTKSYQQKMREWETMQKSQFLVNYRRQSIAPKMDLTNNSRKSSLVKMANEESVNPPSSTANNNSSSVTEELNVEIDTNLTTLGPIFSRNQRFLIVHQWREIMLEEISLRQYNKYLQKQMILLKELETNLKTLKTNIFCTNNTIKQQSITDLKKNIVHQQSYLPSRCRSLQSLISMPASWMLAVQSAAYSDILDGTSNETNERVVLLNKNFFDQLEEFKKDRLKFERNTIENLHSINNSVKNSKRIQDKKQSKRSCAQRLITRGSLRKLSLLSYSEFPQYFLPDPIIPLQTITPQVVESSANTELVSTTTISNNLNIDSKRQPFDFKRTFQHRKNSYINQFNLWLHRHRESQQQKSTKKARASSADTKIKSPCPTPILFGSPRLGRLRQRLFKHHSQTLTQTNDHPIPLEIIDDSDNQSQYDLPVRIYLPPMTTRISQNACVTDLDAGTSESDNYDLHIQQSLNSRTPILYRENELLSSLKNSTTAKERRESFAVLSTVLNKTCL